MKRLPMIHVLLFVAAWVVGYLSGPVGLVIATSVLVGLELVLWRVDLVELPRRRRTWFEVAERDRRGAAPAYDDIRHAVLMGRHSRREFDFALRRRLEHIASSRLAESEDVDLHRDPERARAILGADLWSLIDPRRPISRDRTGGGVSEAELAEFVDRLEKL
ncbi:MAG: hypothetical protein GEU93_03080 [Propionibacteriales bacterium]|nr:hypothetical protein [Propionibacteriales bacterium]